MPAHQEPRPITGALPRPEAAMGPEIPAPPRTRPAIERDINWHRHQRDAERDVGHEGPARWYEARVDQLLDEWKAAAE